jgi:hypothetical protein
MALAFYNAGTIWAHELDIFPTWRLVGANFHEIQTAHWRRLPYWVFGPVIAAFGGSVALVWNHPPQSPVWAIAGTLGCQGASIVLTALFWGRWQGALSHDPRGANSEYLALIVRTHWMRTAFINGSAVIFLIWTVLALGHPT